MTERIYHITTTEAWAAAQATGEYTSAAFEEEGFIHCSYRHQVVPVANRRFRGQTNLVLLSLYRDRTGCPVIDENLEGGPELFPHVYGPLPVGVILEVIHFPCEADGRFALPDRLQA